MFKSSPHTNTESHYEITMQEPSFFSCPFPTSRLWDSHPRVYLPLAKTGHVACPYCGTKYLLVDK